MHRALNRGARFLQQTVFELPPVKKKEQRKQPHERKKATDAQGRAAKSAKKLEK
jgi:hypothetical protein